MMLQLGKLALGTDFASSILNLCHPRSSKLDAGGGTHRPPQS